MVPHSEAAAAGAGRAALLGAGAASGDARLFAAALNDWLHEPYRPSSLLDAMRGTLPGGCVGATLSGSGPTVIAWCDDPECTARELAERFPDYTVLRLEVTPRGAL